MRITIDGRKYRPGELDKDGRPSIEAPTPVVDQARNVIELVGGEHRGGGWYRFPDGSKAHGLAAAVDAANEILDAR